MVACVPLGELSSQSLPPDRWAKPETIERPKPDPLPFGFVVKKGSITRGIISLECLHLYR